MRVTVKWLGQGGELDSRTLYLKPDYSDDVIREALVDMIEEGGIVNPGDSFTVTEEE